MGATRETTSTRTPDGTFPIGTLIAGVAVIAGTLALVLVAVSPSASANLGVEGDDWASPRVPDAEGAKLGSDVAADGDTVIAGAPAEGNGAVYIYEQTGNGWERQARLTSSADQGAGSFGYRVGIDGERLAVAESGNVHLYEETGGEWLHAETIQGPHESFGTSLALDSDRLAVGAHKIDTDDWRDGVVFIYELKEGSWVQSARLEDHGCQQTFGHEKCGNHRFGARDLVLRDDLLVVPAIGGNGELHIFQNKDAGWELSRTFEGLASDDHLGTGGLSLSGDWLFAGARRSNGASHDGGYVMVLHRTPEGWEHAQTLTAEDATQGARFGSPAVAGGQALVGAFWDDEKGTDAGAVYGFELTGGRWIQSFKATPSNGSAGDRVGNKVALTQQIGAVGANLADTEAGEDSGAVYVFPRDNQTQGPTLTRDGFEDGTLEDPWTLTLDGAAEARIVQESFHRGFYAAQLASGCGGDEALGETRLDHRLTEAIESRETFSTWIHPVEFGGYGVWGGIQLLNTTHKSAINWKLSSDGFEYRIVWPDGSHEVTSFGSWDVGNWYHINITVDPETETVTFGAATPDAFLGELQAHDVPLAFDRLSLVSNPGGQQDNCGTYVFDDATFILDSETDDGQKSFDFENGPEGWSTGLHPCKEGSRVDLGGAQWTSKHGGSLELVAEGGPSGGHAWIPLDELDAIEPGSEVRVEYISPDIQGEPGNVQIRLWQSGPFDGEPECSGYKLDGDQGRPDHANATVDGVLEGTVPEDLSNPDDFDLVVKTVVWPGQFTVYVENVTVTGPGTSIDSPDCPQARENLSGLCDRLAKLQQRVQDLEKQVQTLEDGQRSLGDRVRTLESQRAQLVRMLEGRLNISDEEALDGLREATTSSGEGAMDDRGAPTVSTSENQTSPNGMDASDGRARETPAAGMVGVLVLTAVAGLRRWGL